MKIRPARIHCCFAKLRSPTNVNSFVNGGSKRKIVDIVKEIFAVRKIQFSRPLF